MSYEPTGPRARTVTATHDFGVRLPCLAQNDPERSQKMAWIKEHCINRFAADQNRFRPFPHIDAGSYRFSERGVEYDAEAMAATFEANPDMSADSVAYCTAFPHRSWVARND